MTTCTLASESTAIEVARAVCMFILENSTKVRSDHILEFISLKHCEVFALIIDAI